VSEPTTDGIRRPGRIVRFLNETEPAKLLIWCVVALALAGICGIARIELMSGWGWSESQNYWDSPRQVVTLESYDQANDRSGFMFFSQAGSLLLAVCAFAFGVVGGLLPMWAVGRLIADAIKSGNTNA